MYKHERTRCALKYVTRNKKPKSAYISIGTGHPACWGSTLGRLLSRIQSLSRDFTWLAPDTLAPTCNSISGTGPSTLGTVPGMRRFPMDADVSGVGHVGSHKGDCIPRGQ